MGGKSPRGRYGYAHRKERDRVALMLPLPCSRCGRPVTAAHHWDLDHAADGVSYLGPAHRGCNRRAGAINSNRGREPRPRPIVFTNY